MSLLSMLSILGSVFWFSFCHAATNCPLKGPLFPKPQNLSKSAVLQAAIQNLTTQLNQLDNDNTAGTGTNSYSLQVWSTTSTPTLYSHSHTAQNLADTRVGGVANVDGNTVFRIGSPTKVFSVYAFLIAAGDIYFNDPITKYVPELAAIAANQTGNAITTVSWNDITIGELASHMAGISNDNTIIGELSLTIPQNVSVAIGLPPLNASQIPPCGAYPLCTRAQFFQWYQNLDPAFAPSETPAYSNIAFQIFSYALETITGNSFQSSVENGILKPLGLTNTFYTTPSESLGIIPGSWADTQWDVQLGEENPAGGMYSSSNDLATLGRSILSNELLTLPQTNRWLQPATLTSDMHETVGWPWGLRSFNLHPDRPYEITTAYNKAGLIGSYSSLISLLPDYNIGFSILVAGDLTLSNWYLANTLGDTILPAIEQTAREEAQSTYGGTYHATVPGLNSSITLATDPDRPGIGITSWISNSTDMLVIINALTYSTSQFSARLYPTELEVVNQDGSKEVSMKAVFEDLASTVQDGWYFASCGSWIDPTGLVYGAQALDEFVFSMDKTGEVTSVQPLALRVELMKM